MIEIPQAVWDEINGMTDLRLRALRIECASHQACYAPHVITEDDYSVTVHHLGQAKRFRRSRDMGDEIREWLLTNHGC